MDTLIKIASEIGKVTLHNFEYSKDEVEGEDYILKHRGVAINSKNISIIKTGGYIFLWIMNFENKGKSYIYFADDLSKLLVESDEYDNIKGLPIVCINLEDKEYCIELTTNEFNFLYINFITTLPLGCDKKECKRLKGLFSVLYKFLINIKYNGPISLKDDVQVNGNFLTIKRALNNNPTISIYQRYGFEMSEKRYNDIRKAVINKDIKKLEEIARNIPMIALNIEKFNQC